MRFDNNSRFAAKAWKPWRSAIPGFVSKRVGTCAMLLLLVMSFIKPASGTALFLKQISTGGGHSCGIANDGRAFCWGSNIFGQLGDGTRADRSVAVAVRGNLRFSQISAGLSHTCARSTGGISYCWGENSFGTNGDGTFDQSLVPVRAAGGRVFSFIAAGAAATCGLTADGTAFCWGNNYWGQLGNGEKDTVEPRPRCAWSADYTSPSSA